MAPKEDLRGCACILYGERVGDDRSVCCIRCGGASLARFADKLGAGCWYCNDWQAAITHHVAVDITEDWDVQRYLLGGRKPPSLGQDKAV